MIVMGIDTHNEWTYPTRGTRGQKDKQKILLCVSVSREKNKVVVVVDLSLATVSSQINQSTYYSSHIYP